MRRRNTRTFLSLSLLACLFWQTVPSRAMQTPATAAVVQQAAGQSGAQVINELLRQARGGDYETLLEKIFGDRAAEAGVWTGVITAERHRREEKETRSGSNLAENGGHLETATRVRLRLTGRRDASADAANAYIGHVTGEQEHVDYEYDRYKVDEGYCGANAVPYKGPKELTRTSRTAARYDKETRVRVDIGASGGSVAFSLHEAAGRTVHSYVHKSPCAEHDRANTNEAVDEEVAMTGGGFSFTFPLDPTRASTTGSLTVREDDGGVTTYTWELTRN